MSIYTPKRFQAHELLDQRTFERFGDEGLRYFRPAILIALDWIAENYPVADGIARAVVVNNWKAGGPNQWRGIRTPDCKEWKPYSAHSFGAAIDLVTAGCSAAKLQDWLKATHAATLAMPVAENLPILNIRRIERATPSWTHIDCLEHGSRSLLEVSP